MLHRHMLHRHVLYRHIKLYQHNMLYRFIVLYTHNRVLGLLPRGQGCDSYQRNLQHGDRNNGARRFDAGCILSAGRSRAFEMWRALAKFYENVRESEYGYY